MLEHWQEVIAMVQARPDQQAEPIDAPAPAAVVEEHTGSRTESPEHAGPGHVAIGADPFAAG